MSQFLIINPRRSRGDLVAFYGVDLSELTHNIDDAARFSEDRVRAMPDVYNNGRDARAIPLDSVLEHVRSVMATADLSKIRVRKS